MSWKNVNFLYPSRGQNVCNLGPIRLSRPDILYWWIVKFQDVHATEQKTIYILNLFCTDNVFFDSLW